MDSYVLTNCQICNDEYTKENKPLVIHCGNTLCEVCLKDNWNRVMIIECMFCKKKHLQELKNLPINELIYSLFLKKGKFLNGNFKI